MRQQISLVLSAVAAILAVPAGPAGAHESPTNCTSSGVRFALTGNDIGVIHRNGDVISVTPKIGNFAAGACDISNATVTLTFPKPDGTSGGQSVTVATNADFPGGADFTEYPPVQHTVNFNDGVFRGPVTLAISGTQHFPGGDTSGAIGSLGAPLAISRPHATVTVTPSAASGDAPLGVTYNYSVTNDSPLDPMDVPVHMASVSVADDLCAPLTFTGTDTGNSDILDRGETWTYTCNRTLPGGVFTNHVTVDGSSLRDGRDWPRATAQSTVTVNGSDMTITASHAGDFTQGDAGRTYTLTATNSGNRSSTGLVTVADMLPVGLSATAISGSGWSCTVGTLTCTRTDALAAGVSYPPITVTVDVASSAPASVVNTATVTRAGENTANDTATDPTTIAPRTTAPDGGPGPGPGPGPSGGGTSILPDTLAPTLTARMTNTKFAVDPRGPAEPLVNARAKKGTRFVYRLSEPARVLFTIERREKGRRVGTTCRKPSKSNRKRKACVRFVKVGSFAQNGKAGANTRKWSGKIRSKGLKPGTYRASLSARDVARNASSVKRISFKVVAR
jgi:uncharacterized repeat protein (TIGR01451 family)